MIAMMNIWNCVYNQKNYFDPAHPTKIVLGQLSPNIAHGKRFKLIKHELVIPSPCCWVILNCFKPEKNWIIISTRLVGYCNSQFHSELFGLFSITLKWKFLPNWRLGMCRFIFSILSKTESPGVTNIENDHHRYSQTGSWVQGAQNKRLHNVTGLDCTQFLLSKVHT